MDHLPLPDGVNPFIVAPYEAPTGDWWDKGHYDFLTFADRQGWTEEELRGETAHDDVFQKGGFKAGKTNEQVEQFFQTWLFFGLAIEMLKLGGVTITTETFLKPQTSIKARIIDTSELPKLLVRWEKGVKQAGDLSGTWDRLNEMFEKTAEVLDRFCTPHDESSPEYRDRRRWPVRDQVSTTMIALAFSLRRAATDVCHPDIDTMSPWPTRARSEILAKRLVRLQCVADVTTTLKQLPIDGHYYLAGSEGLSWDELDHHSKCVRAHCMYDYDAHMYVTKHAGPEYHTDPCRETINYGGQLGPERGQRDWEDAITRILTKDDVVPLALWLKGPRQLFSVEYHIKGSRKPDYVAISHVWTDGKGNPKKNELPECQLDKIQRLIEKVTWEGRKEIPSNPNLSDGTGFWMDTLCIPAVNKPLKTKAIKTMRDVYSNAKAVLVLDDWLQEIPSDAPPLQVVARLYQSNWTKRLWTHQEGYLPPALWFQFRDRPVQLKDMQSRLEAHQKSLDAAGTHLGFPVNANMSLVELYTFLNDAFKMTEPEDKYILFRPLAAAMSERKTSRLADETVCLATIVEVDMTDILKISTDDDEADAMARMEVFLRIIGRFDTSMIFNNYPRLKSRGYKWAPRSLLNLRTAELAYESDPDAAFEPFHGQMGLLVQYHGFVFRLGNPSFTAVERGFAIQCEGDADSDQDVDGKWFVVEHHPARIEWSKWRNYALILYEIPSESGQRCPAVLAGLNSGPSNGVYTVDHESIASVKVQETAPEWADITQARLLSKGTEWLVV